jgi:basic membrane protein A
MLKRVDQAAYLMVQKVVDGTWQGGEVLYMDIANGGVSLTDMSVMRGVLGDDFPMEILDKVAELTEKVKAGEIVVETYEGFRRN